MLFAAISAQVTIGGLRDAAVFRIGNMVGDVGADDAARSRSAGSSGGLALAALLH
jgi:hypothetical protein